MAFANQTIKTTHNYYEWLELKRLKPKPNGVWASIGSPVDEYGWKLHLSSIQFEAHALLEIVTPILVRYGFPFKVARDAEILGMLNEGEFGPTQMGKFITIYPPSHDDSFLLSQDLIRITDTFSGPRIVTDLWLGGVVYTRYGSYNPKMVRDRLGNITQLDPSGVAEYKVPFVAPKGVHNPFSSYVHKYNSKKHGPALIGPGFLVLRPLSIHAKGSVYLALDLRRQEDVALVVLKEGRRHCMSDMYGRDIWDRLRHQESMHQILGRTIAVPCAGPVFQHAENLYLTIEYIEGRNFAERPAVPFGVLSSESKEALLADLRQVVATVRNLHNEGFIHRDLSPRNIRISEKGAAYLLDLELCYQKGDSSSPPFAQGTPGFVSPQQLLGERPSISDDIYALGALMINSITGIDPRRIFLERHEGLADRIGSLSGAPLCLCRLACQCVCPDPEKRPSLDDITFSLERTTTMLVDKQRPGSIVYRANLVKRDQVIETALYWLIHGCKRDEVHGLWLSPEIEATNHDATLRLPHTYCLYRSASRGVAGVVYTIARLHRFGFSVPTAGAQINSAVDWLLSHDATPDDQMPGLHYGEAGVAVAIAEAVTSGLIEIGDWLLPYLNEALSGPVDWPDLTHGAAGQAVAALNCAILLRIPELAAHSHRCIAYLLRQQHLDGSWAWPDGVKGMEGVIYTGFAHGVAGIVYCLSVYASYFGDANAKAAAQRGGKWLLKQARSSHDEKSIWWPMQSDHDESWRWWCHGGPGIAIAFLALFELTGERQYADTARLALNTHPAEVRYSNLSQCHGLSGLGEILLEATRVLRESEWGLRAENIGLTLRALGREGQNGTCWLVENPHHSTADLMIGCSGVAHFLARLSSDQPSLFGMPLLL